MSTDLFVRDTIRMGIIQTIEGVLKASKHALIKTRLPGAVYPAIVKGTKSDQRPDISCEGPKRKVIVAAVTAADMKDLEALHQRLYLFYAKSIGHKWDFQIACFRDVAAPLKNFCRKNAIRYSKMWEI